MKKFLTLLVLAIVSVISAHADPVTITWKLDSNTGTTPSIDGTSLITASDLTFNPSILKTHDHRYVDDCDGFKTAEGIRICTVNTVTGTGSASSTSDYWVQYPFSVPPRI